MPQGAVSQNAENLSPAEYLEHAFEQGTSGPDDELIITRQLFEVLDDHEIGDDGHCWTCDAAQDQYDSPEAMQWYPPDEPDGWYQEWDGLILRWYSSGKPLPPPARIFTLGPEYPTVA